MQLLVLLVSLLINVYIGLLIVGAVLSWFIHDPRHPLIRTIDRLTDPILKPIRRVLGMTGPVDFSPLVAILLLGLLRRLLVGLL
ncbi:MAG: YggT family protein [FCB group bacterium]|jgi:YggT family protein|nr:YggT family protein [FCB group bacterium]